MASELQRLVDGLAWRLRRNIAVDDARIRLQAYSSHGAAPVDAAREQSILMREVPKDVAEYVYSAGARTATAPFRLPTAPELGLTTERVCIPVRQGGSLLGFVWVLEGDDRLNEQELQFAAEAAEAIGVVLARELRQEDSGRTRELVRDLLADERRARAAAAELVDEHLFVGGEAVRVLVVTLDHEGRELVEDEREVVTGWVDRVVGRLTERRRLSLVRRDHAVVLVSEKDPVAADDGVAALAGELVDGIRDGLPLAAPRVGIGQRVEELREAHLSYRHARRAAAVGRRVDAPAAVTRFEELGIYALLSSIPPEELTVDTLPPGLVRLLRSGPKAVELVRTLEAYLDHGGDVRASAEELIIHRATLYYRLQRVEELTGLDLSRGDDRLAAHVGLKTARLAGLLPGGGTEQRAGGNG